MTRKNMLIRVLMVVLAVILVAASCGDDDDDDGAETDSAADDGGGGDDSAANDDDGGDADAVMIGYVLSGPTNDGGFYEDQATSLQNAAEEYGYEVRIVENAVDPADQVAGMRNLANEGAALILGDGAMSDAAATAAKEFPDVEFAVITAPRFEAVDNLSGYIVSQGIPSYVMGVVASAISGTGNAGYIGGFEIPPTAETRAGFFQGFSDSGGATTADTNVGDFNDAVGAKAAAEAQIANGIDTIYAFVDAGFPGVVQAVEESGEQVSLWGATVDHCVDGPQVVGNALANSQAVLEVVLADFSSGSMAHDNVFFGLEDPDIQRVELCAGYEEWQDLVDETTAALVNGEIELDPAVTGG